MELHNSLGRLLVELVPALELRDMFLCCRHPADQGGFEGLRIDYVEWLCWTLEGRKDVVYWCNCMLVVVLFVLCISVHCWIFRVYMLWILRKESVLLKSQYLKVHKHYNGYHYRSRVGLLTSSSSKMVEDGEEIAEVIRQLIASWQKAECSEDPKGGMWPKVQHNEVKLIMVVWVLHPVRYLVLV